MKLTKHLPFLFLFIFLYSCSTKQEVKWLTWDQWNEVAKLKDKKGLVWIHSPTCDDCIRMEEVTFQHPEIIAYLNEHFHVIKLDINEKETIETKGREFRYVTDMQGITYHELAAAMSIKKDQIATPTFAFLDENFDLITPIPQSLEPDEMDLLLHFVNEDAFRSMNVDEFKKTYKSNIK